MNYVIYKIVNFEGQIYIGQTDNFKRRINSYKKLQCKGQQLLYKSLKHYGFENHMIEVIYSSAVDNLDEKEIELIEKNNSYYYDNQPIGLNLTKGGKSKRGYKTSQETKDKISKGNKGKKGLVGRIFSDEVKLKMSNSRKEGILNGSIKKNNKTVLKFDLEGNFIEEINNLTDLATIIKIKLSSLSLWLSQNEYYYFDNFKFKLKNSKDIIQKLYKRNVKVNQINITDNSIINTWTSISKLSKYLKMSYSTTFRKLNKELIINNYKYIKV